MQGAIRRLLSDPKVAEYLDQHCQVVNIMERPLWEHLPPEMRERCMERQPRLPKDQKAKVVYRPLAK